MAGRPPGSENKNKRFRAALIRYADADPKRLDALAEKAWGEALAGDIQAMTMIRDTMDGKPAQEQQVNITDQRERMTDAELRAFIAAAIAGTLSGGNGVAKPEDSEVIH